MLNWFEKVNINNDTVEIAKALKQNGYSIYVLSNMAKSTYEYKGKWVVLIIIFGMALFAGL